MYFINNFIYKHKNLKINQIYTSCLAQYAYIITSGKESIIIDPIREINYYLDYLKSNNSYLKYILLTHFHADFVSGHIPLYKETNADVCMFENSKANFNFKPLKNKEILDINENQIQVLHTPGHTLESISYLLKEKNENNHKEIGLFSGDTIFMGDVGRPDLASNETLKTEDMAGFMYDSVNKIKKLDKDITIFPGHGSGSPCGKNIQSKLNDTLENQLKTNYAFNINSKDEFINEISKDWSKPLFYFKNDILMNKSHKTESLENTVENLYKKFDINQLTNIIESKNLEYNILDCRSTIDFQNKNLKLSVNSPIDNKFAIFTGSLIKNNNIIIIGNRGRNKEAIHRLLRIGYDNILGYINYEEIENIEILFEKINNIEPEEIIKKENYNLLDVRNIGEWSNGYIDNATKLSLNEIVYDNFKLNKTKDIYIYCAAGMRSIMAYSLLKKKGYNNIYNVIGGYQKLKDVGF